MAYRRLKCEQLQNCSFLLKLSDINKSTSDADYVLGIPFFLLTRDYQHLSVEKKLGCNVFSINKEEERALVEIQVAERSFKSQKENSVLFKILVKLAYHDP